MIHYTCDRCRRIINLEREFRYEIRVDVHAHLEPADANEPEDDRDHLHELHELMCQASDEEHELVVSQAERERRYDLCSDCFESYIKNPVGQDLQVQLGFSEN